MIIYIGNFRPSWSTENYVARSFEDLKHLVVRMQEEDTTSEDVIQAACRADPELVLYTRTWGLKDHDAGGFRLWQQLRRKGFPTAMLTLDLYWGLNREPMIKTDPMWHTDVVFTADGGNQERFAAEGINHVWMPPAVYKHECGWGRYQERYASEIAFVGSTQHYHQEWLFRKIMVQELEARYGTGFRHWGKGEQWVRGWALNDLFASVKVVVGDSLHRPRYWSDRIPETLGRGGLLVCPRVEGLEEVGYRCDQHLLYYTPACLEELFEEIDRALAFSDRHRRWIQEGGMRHVRDAGHTYEDRCQFILETVRRHCGHERREIPSVQV
jgi:hypothetical protein